MNHWILQIQNWKKADYFSELEKGFSKLLANNYQAYGLNYLDEIKQTEKCSKEQANNILYLYMKSIDYAQKSLEFEMDFDDKIKIIKYIKARYKDISDCIFLDNDI